MLFGNEKRFNKDLKPQRANDICGYGKFTETESHVGPGSYFTQRTENKRGGWEPNSFSQRQPMSPDSKNLDRSNSYRDGILLPSGIMVPGSPKQKATPGPGSYLAQSPSPKSRPGSAHSHGSTSPRLLNSTAVVRDGVIFQSSPKNNPVGPGSYSPSQSDLLKRSFNIKASPGKSPKNGNNMSFQSNHSYNNNISMIHQEYSHGSFMHLSPRSLDAHRQSSRGNSPQQMERQHYY